MTFKEAIIGKTSEDPNEADRGPAGRTLWWMVGSAKGNEQEI
jgi:hypothetical protein